MYERERMMNVIGVEKSKAYNNELRVKSRMKERQ